MAQAYQPRTELYRFHFGVILSAVLLATLLQAFLPLYLSLFALLDLPLLVVIYFGFSRRNPTTGLLLGLAVGILQDALSHQPIGLFGMAKTVLGFAASSLSSRIDTDHARARLILVFLFYHLHQLVYAGSQWLLLDQSTQLVSLTGLESALVNSLLGMLVFYAFDRFRRAL